jgi:hypothetical protein
MSEEGALLDVDVESVSQEKQRRGTSLLGMDENPEDLELSQEEPNGSQFCSRYPPSLPG